MSAIQVVRNLERQEVLLADRWEPPPSAGTYIPNAMDINLADKKGNTFYVSGAFKNADGDYISRDNVYLVASVRFPSGVAFNLPITSISKYKLYSDDHMYTDLSTTSLFILTLFYI